MTRTQALRLARKWGDDSGELDPPSFIPGGDSKSAAYPPTSANPQAEVHSFRVTSKTGK
jgi:hypothetical protein